MVALVRSEAGVKVSPSTGKNSGVPSSVPVWKTAEYNVPVRPQEIILYPCAIAVSQSVEPNMYVQGIGRPVAVSVFSEPTTPQKNAVVVVCHCSPFRPYRLAYVPAPLPNRTSFPTVVWLTPGVSRYHMANVPAVVKAPVIPVKTGFPFASRSGCTMPVSAVV